MSRPEEPLALPLSQHLEPAPSEESEARIWAKVSARRAVSGGRIARNKPELPLPIASLLLTGDDLPHVRARLFRRVQARIHRPASRGLLRPLLVLGGALGVAVCLFLSWRGIGGVLGDQHEVLLRGDGRPLGQVAAGDKSEVIKLADSSEVTLQPFTHLETLVSTSSRFELRLSAGSAEFAVAPGGPRRWSIEAGTARIEVVGTVFRVARTRASVHVAVSRGVVLVRGPNMPDGGVHLTAGQQLDIPAQASPREGATGLLDDAGSATEATPQPAESATEAPPLPIELASEARPRFAESAHVVPDVDSAVPAEIATATLSRSAREKPRAEAAPPYWAIGTPDVKYALLGPAGMVRETMRATEIGTLLELADVARLSGHPEDAVAPLTRALEVFRNSPQAGLAAFTLGRVLLDQLGAPEAAAAAFERAIALHVPRALLADCYRRLAEAYDRSGDAAKRAIAETRFRAAFPSSLRDAGEPLP